jgi:hypothetical protein
VGLPVQKLTATIHEDELEKFEAWFASHFAGRKDSYKVARIFRDEWIIDDESVRTREPDGMSKGRNSRVRTTSATTAHVR